ncbi:MAG: hypothetical protein EP343_17760 [Deltaproteobacteria bacterium]|nr:MAG: hypothetical protein EP343_17760 [Deltaproteobacteria bacterium]
MRRPHHRAAPMQQHTHKPNDEELQGTPPPECSQDTMFRGRVKLQQHRRGYRFSADAVLLSHFAAHHSPAPALDIGTGCGVVALLLADLWSQHGATPPITAVERQPALAELARTNIQANEHLSHVTLVETDIRPWNPQPPATWRVITCNPPYRTPQSGNISPNPERAAARHELHGSLEELVQAAAQRLHPQGHFCLVYPAFQMPRMMQALHQARLHVTRLRWVHPRSHAPARLMLIEARKGQAPFAVEPPLILYRSDAPRDYTDEANRIFDGYSPQQDTTAPEER